MARTTARQAFTRSRAKRVSNREAAAKAMKAAREKFLQQLSVLGAAINQKSDKKPVTVPMENSNTRKPVLQNHKITEYYLVMSRGRENVPKSSRQIERTLDIHPNKSLGRGETFNKGPLSSHISAGNSTVGHEVITLDDSDDDGEEAINRSQIMLGYTSDNNTSDMESSVESPFTDSNISLRVGDDIEIVDMLPPIPLRDHPVVDLDD